MKKFILVPAALLLFTACGVNRAVNQPAPSPAASGPDISNLIIEKHMDLASTAFAGNESIPSDYTCDGKNVNPALLWHGAPDGTKTLALIVDDPDAPAGTWTHWTVWNIDPGAGSIKENSVPDSAVEGTTDFGRAGWGGPCPPSDEHRYFFRLYALDTSLSLPAGAARSELETAMAGHILGQAELMGKYQR